MNPTILDSLAWAEVKAIAIIALAFANLMYLAWLGTQGSSSKHENRFVVALVRRGVAILPRLRLSSSRSKGDSVSMPAFQRGPVEPNI